MSSDESAPKGRKYRVHLNPQYLPSKRKKVIAVVDDPRRVHRELKNYLLLRRLVVERSVLAERRKEARQIDLFLTYLRSLDRE